MNHSPSHPQRASLFDRPLPPGYRDEIQALIAERPVSPPRQVGSTLLFQLGDLYLALPTRVASAVAPVLHVARVPHRSGTVLLGLVAHHGDILPCCSLASLLDLPQNPVKSDTGTPRTLILEESPGRRWAVPIDGVIGVRVADHQFSESAAPQAANSQWFKGSLTENAGSGKRGTYYVLDHDVVFRQLNLATA